MARRCLDNTTVMTGLHRQDRSRGGKAGAVAPDFLLRRSGNRMRQDEGAELSPDAEPEHAKRAQESKQMEIDF